MTPEQWMDAWHNAWQRSLTKCRTFLLCAKTPCECCKDDPKALEQQRLLRRAMKFERRYYQAHTNYIVSVYSTPR